MSKEQVIKSLKDTGVIAVIRTDSSAELIGAAKALLAGGVRFIEITMTTPGALEVIREAARRLSGQAIMGAGTVLDAEGAKAAIDAGAEFIVSPVFDKSVVELCHSRQKVVVPGAYTPSEIFAAWQGGADIVKIFPANIGGPKYFKDLKGPLPQIEILPTGGVNLQTAPEFIKAGACAVAVGRALVDKRYIKAGDFKTITENAEKFCEVIRKAREE